MTFHHRFSARLLVILFVMSPAIAVAQIEPASDAPQPMSPEESAARIQLPEGFKIELVASEPLVQDPTCIAFDEHGRLFVCELHGYNLEGQLDVEELNKTGQLDKTVQRIRWELLGGKIAEEAKKHQFGTVKLLSDTDADGLMDRADVWADRLPPCYGLLPARGGVIVVCAPDIVFLADRDGDGKAEIRETLYTGFHTSVLERGINNPRWGLDNWIYVGAGGHGGTIRGSRLAKPVQLSHSDFRVRPDGSAIEPVSGTVGTFGLTLNDLGDRFPCGGSRPAMYALPLEHRYLNRNPYVATPEMTHAAADYSHGYRISAPHPWRVKRRQDPAWVKFYGERETDSGYFTGGCGGEIYRGNLFPEAYHGNFFYCEPSLNIVHRSVLQRDGPGYKARRALGEEESEFLSSTDQWFRPINLRVGPDGALYIVDMYREIIEDYSAIPRFLQQQYRLVNGSDRGRIWRVRPESKWSDDLVRLGDASTHELVRATGDSKAWRRTTAQRLLIERGDRSAAAELSEQVHGATTPQARLHALYSLQGLDELKRSDVAHALDDNHYGVRMHGLQLAEHWLDTDIVLLEKVINMTSDPDVRVRLQLAMSLGQTRAPRAGSAILSLARRHGHERWMSAAILSSARDSAGQWLVELLGDRELSVGARSLLAPLAATMARQRDAKQMAGALRALLNRNEDAQTHCLQGLVAGLSSGAEPVPESRDAWNPVKQLLGSKSPQIRALATKLGVRLQLTNRPEMQAAFAAAADEAIDMNRPIDQRRQAVEVLADAPFATLTSVTTELLDPRESPTLQLAAIGALAGSNDERVSAALLERWEELTPQLRGAVINAFFARENRLPAMLNAIENRTIRPGDIDALRREQLTNSQNLALAARAQKVFATTAAGAELQERFKRYRQALLGEQSTARGKEVFAKNCLDCHKIKDEGHEVGPDLRTVMNKPDEAILLDLLDPSDHIQSDYATYIVLTSDGVISTGVLVSDSANNVTLRKEKNVNETILRQDIEFMRASEVSMMPSNLYEQITPQDAADLIAYLRKALEVR